LEFSVSKPDSR